MQRKIVLTPEKLAEKMPHNAQHCKNVRMIMYCDTCRGCVLRQSKSKSKCLDRCAYCPSTPGFALSIEGKLARTAHSWTQLYLSVKLINMHPRARRDSHPPKKRTALPPSPVPDTCMTKPRRRRLARTQALRA